MPLTLTVSHDLLARIHNAAAKAGLPPEVWTARVLADALDPSGVREDASTFDATSRGEDLLAMQTPQARAFQHAAALAALEEYDRTGISYPLDDVLSEVRADLEIRLAAKA